VAIVAEQRLRDAEPGREQNEIARDSFSYLHFPMVAGIVLLALGMKKTLGHVEEPLKLVPAFAMLAGTSIYLMAHIAFRWRNVHRFSPRRLFVALLICALIPLALEIPALATLAILFAVLVTSISYEYFRFGDIRTRLRATLASDSVH
jgi:low temperature requirement protein LtrA